MKQHGYHNQGPTWTVQRVTTSLTKTLQPRPVCGCSRYSATAGEALRRCTLRVAASSTDLAVRASEHVGLELRGQPMCLRRAHLNLERLLQSLDVVALDEDMRVVEGLEEEGNRRSAAAAA